jgi:fructokinase
MILSIGEILFDIFPEGRRLGGAPFNFAYHLHGLNIPVRFLSRIGSDPEGQAIVDFLKANAFPTGDLQSDPEHPTGRVEVTIDAEKGPQFNILPDMAYDFITATPSIEQYVAQECRLIYFGSLIQRTSHAARTVRRLLQRRSPRARCLYDVNLRPGCFDADILEFSLGETDILKLNEDEITALAAMKTIRGDTATIAKTLMSRYDIEMVVVTGAEQGSRIVTRDSQHHIQPSHDVQIADTVGAGDAYAAMLAIGYIRKWPPEQILSVAQSLASAVCGISGAVPTDRSFYNFWGELTSTGDNHG